MAYYSIKRYLGNNIMIRKIGVKNFFCFEDGVEINFELDRKVPEEFRQGRDVTSVLGIKGANGSGKTNIIKTIDFLSNFCAHSANSKEADEIDIRTYFYIDGLTEFYIEFNKGGNRFYYELDVTNKKVVREVLYRTTSRKVKIFERANDEIIDCIEDVSELKNIILKSNASVISIFDTFKFKSEMEDIAQVNLFFSKVITNVTHLGYFDMGWDYRIASKEYNQDPELFKFVKAIIMLSDNGISDITINQTTDSDGKEYFYPTFVHSHGSDNYFLTYYDESSGTKALFKKMYTYWLVLTTGGILALDEFDIHIHSMILPALVDLFIDKKINTRNAQFIFTAHNTEIIETLGKYRTILVNKEDNASYCYRLDEIPGNMIRNDRAISPLYLKGKLGGVPLKGITNMEVNSDEEF